MITVTMTITLSETDARHLWTPPDDYDGPEDPAPPIDQELADWVAQHAMTTIESNWQFDDGVDPHVTAGASTETLMLLKELRALPINPTTDNPEYRAAVARYDEIEEDLCGDGADDSLETLLEAYAPLLATT